MNREKELHVILGRIDWHAQLGYNSFETLPYDAACRNAKWRLAAIMRLLDAADQIRILDGFDPPNGYGEPEGIRSFCNVVEVMDCWSAISAKLGANRR